MHVFICQGDDTGEKYKCHRYCTLFQLTWVTPFVLSLCCGERDLDLSSHVRCLTSPNWTVNCGVLSWLWKINSLYLRLHLGKERHASSIIRQKLCSSATPPPHLLLLTSSLTGCSPCARSGWECVCVCVSHGWLYGISALAPREGGRGKNAVSSVLVVLPDTLDIY